MRWSQAFIPTLREDPADAEAVSHKLLVRGGYIRQLMSGVYSMLPLGQRVREKVMGIIREEMDASGGQEFLELSASTVRTVVTGVLGVAAIQGTLAGLV